MKKQKKYFNLETYDYTPYARELTEEELYLVNGGRQMKSDRTNDSDLDKYLKKSYDGENSFIYFRDPLDYQ